MFVLSRSISYILSAGFFLAASTASFAAPLDIRTAAESAIRNSPVLEESRRKQEEFRFQASAMRATLFPSLDAKATAARMKSFVANQPFTYFGGDPYNRYDVSFQLTQPILVWGSIASVRQAGIDRDISAAEQEITERNLTRDVISAFYRVIFNQNLIGILLDEEQVIKEALSTARTRLGLGGRRLDLLQVRTREALLQPRLQSARNDLASSAAELAKIMGEPGRGNVELKGKLPTLNFTAIEKQLNLKEFYLPEIEKLRLSRERLDQERSVQLGKHLPAVRFEANYAFQNFTKSELFLPGANSWTAQLVLSVPIFSGLSSIFERRALNSRDEQLQFQERDIANALSLEQVKSRKVLETSNASLSYAEEGARLARESMGQAARDYRFGHIDFLQYLQVQQSNFEAVTSLSQQKYDYIVALTNYFTASGLPLAQLLDILATEDQKP